MGKHEDSLLAAIDEGHPEKVVKLLDGLSEKERRSLKKTLDAAPDLTERDEYRTLPLDRRRGHQDAKGLARLGLQTFSELKKQWREPLRVEHDLALEILASRKPEFLVRYVDFILDRPGGWPFFGWQLVRQLFRRNLIKRPEHPNYILGLINGLGRIDWQKTRDLSREEADKVRQQALIEDLTQDKDLLENEIWGLFEVEGTREASLSDRQPWGPVLKQLSEKGVIHRQRLLDASLDALVRDFSEHKSRWYLYFHRLLEPTAKERADRASRYTRLLTSEANSIVLFALEFLTALIENDDIKVDTIADELTIAAGQKAKKTVLQVLKMVLKAGAGSQSKTAAMLACAAFAHDNRDVQRRALEVLETCSSIPEELREDLYAAAQSAHPTLRKRAEALSDVDSEPASSISADESETPDSIFAEAQALPRKARKLYGIDAALEAVEKHRPPPLMLSFERSSLPCLRSDHLIAPIDDVEELIDCAGEALENAEDIELIERVMDGLSRLCDRRPEGFKKRTGPLKKRARVLSKRTGKPFDGWQLPESIVIGLVSAWLEEDVEIPDEITATGLSAFFIHRAIEIGRRIAKQKSAPLLSAPTHRPGFIDPVVCVKRLDGGLPFADHDVVAALLRLAPEGRSKALKMLKNLDRDDVIVDAMAHALGDPATARLRKSQAFLVAAARSRAPHQQSPEVMKNKRLASTPGGSHPGSANITIGKRRQGTATYPVLSVTFSPPAPTKVANSLFPTIGFAGQQPKGKNDYTWSDHACPDLTTVGLVKWAAWVWPTNRMLYNTEGARRMIGLIRWSEAEWENAIFLEPLNDPCEPIDENAALAIAAGLCCKRPHETARAVDVAMAALSDGRLDGQMLGRAMSVLFAAGISMPARWAQQLGIIAQENDFLRHECLIAVQRSLRGELAKGSHALLDYLLVECMEVGCAVSDSEARKFLETVKGSSKAARLSRELLALSEDKKRMNQFRARAVLSALDGRLNRLKECEGD